MIVRIVKMTFQPQHVADFVQVFEASKEQIRAFEGCLHLELLQHSSKSIFTTYSHWESEKHLDAYRHSELFKQTWAQTKVLFAAKPEAWSSKQLHRLP